jgi:hypothetical protein
MRGDSSIPANSQANFKSEARIVPSRVEPQVKEEEFKHVVAASSIQFDNLGDDEFGDNSPHSPKASASFPPSTVTFPRPRPTNDDASDTKKLLHINYELESRLIDVKTVRAELEAENDKLHKAQIQLQEQNSELQQDRQLWNDRAVKVRGLYRALQAEFQSLQERYEEKCRQLRECEKQDPQHEHVKQEHVKQECIEDGAAELQQPLRLQASRRQCDNVSSVNADSERLPSSEIMSEERVKQDALASDESDGNTVGADEDDDSESDNGEEGCSDNEGEDEGPDEQPSKR